ncbi:unnamed protein product (macronuclear) [Paramecium tetraurelia]|uniref:Protein kinase domain-containing protein n=1 Tax=Paramecium tetraurelia TaxID=5888 RepID=A0D818_PARTE|nr:uncharacterized protein GSPATT00014152001 [Paramecium tetraurelia]CAK79185.1 unnamed protein product [Paramecium tetraurelia]|eukprot:XP_001446582.1 hypothetical protein (macronuclear) [Paramecium tetraurelia strain d4-2]
MQSKIDRSFFDEQTIDSSFWEKSISQINNDKIEHQFIFFEKSQKTGIWVSRNYAIYDSKLIKLRPNHKTQHQINLNKSRIEKIIYKNDQEKESCNRKKYGIRITRNQRCREFYSRSQEINQKIWEELKKQSLQITFKQDYDIQKMIGKGNFAKVYLCNKKSDKLYFAVKVFEKSKMINTETDRLALLKEISILRKLNYKGLIKLHEVYEDETHIYLVQDYLQGGELYQHIKKNQKLPENIVAGVIATILKSLEYLHKNNILHRDLKPENMILRKKGVLEDIVITDFGLADFCDPFGNYMFQRCGTPGFVAPEVLQDKLYDSKVDIFSVGCLMYLLLTGKSPFKGSSYDEIVMKNFNCKVDYQSIESIVSTQCLQLLKLLLHRRPSQRPNPNEALKQEWFQINLDGQRYLELNNNAEQGQSKKEITKSSSNDIGSCGYMKYFSCGIPEFCTAQISIVNNKQDAFIYTPQYAMMQSIQEQFKDSEKFISIRNLEGDFGDMIFEDEPPQSHKLPQYQLIGKLKKFVDQNHSTNQASQILLLKSTSQDQSIFNRTQPKIDNELLKQS